NEMGGHFIRLWRLCSDRPPMSEGLYRPLLSNFFGFVTFAYPNAELTLCFAPYSGPSVCLFSSLGS
uniref:hypothetical protein n=1 Tax=Pseudomonas viridiflava TaxID=33069 RepID=UPI0019D28A1B